MKCPYTTACERCGLMNHEICNTCIEMTHLMDCVNVDTSGMSPLIPCEECRFYNKGVRPMGSAPIMDSIKNIFK